MVREDGGEVREGFAEAEEFTCVKRVVHQGREVSRRRRGWAVGFGEGVGSGKGPWAGRWRDDAVDDVGAAFGEVGEGEVEGKSWDGHAGQAEEIGVLVVEMEME